MRTRLTGRKLDKYWQARGERENEYSEFRCVMYEKWTWLREEGTGRRVNGYAVVVQYNESEEWVKRRRVVYRDKWNQGEQLGRRVRQPGGPEKEGE